MQRVVLTCHSARLVTATGRRILSVKMCCRETRKKGEEVRKQAEQKKE
jgi:hypothetical protein